MKALRVAALCLIAGLALPAAPPAVQAQSEQQEENLVPQPMREKQFPINVSYTVVSLNGRAFPGENPAMILDTNFRLRGFGGCNNYSAIAYPQLEQGHRRRALRSDQPRMRARGDERRARLPRGASRRARMGYPGQSPHA
jgi:hypothetical protein